MGFYGRNDFAGALASKTRTPIMIIQIDGAGASTTRYLDIPVPDAARAEMIDSGIAFLTFESDSEARETFDLILAEFPQPHRTTLGITVTLGLPRQRTHTFHQNDHRSTSTAASSRGSTARSIGRRILQSGCHKIEETDQ